MRRVIMAGDALMEIGVWLTLLSLYQGAFSFIFVCLRYPALIKARFRRRYSRVWMFVYWTYLVCGIASALTLLFLSAVTSLGGVSAATLVPLMTVINLIALLRVTSSPGSFSVSESVDTLPIVSFRTKPLNLVFRGGLLLLTGLITILAGLIFSSKLTL